MSIVNFKIFVVGYTGATGSYLLKVLANDDRFKEVVLFGRRNIEINYGENSTKFIQKQVDFDKLDESSELFKDNFDGGFCCLGTTRGKSGKDGFIKVDYDYTLKFAELAKAGGCKQYHLVSSQGADSKSYFLYPKIKGMVEDAIINLKLPFLSIYRPKFLVGNRDETRYGESFLKTIIKPIAYFSPSLLTTPLEILAKSMVNNFVGNSKKLESQSVEPSHEIVDNSQIFLLGSSI